MVPNYSRGDEQPPNYSVFGRISAPESAELDLDLVFSGSSLFSVE